MRAKAELSWLAPAWRWYGTNLANADVSLGEREVIVRNADSYNTSIVCPVL
jgi:hypothetical protein